MMALLWGISLLSLLIWVGLLTVWGQFWQTDQQIQVTDGESLKEYPSVCALIPARNEVELIGDSLRSLLAQDYPGCFRIILVDDQSSDGTAEVAVKTALELQQSDKLTLLSGVPLAPGWTGKLWAMEQGVKYVQTLDSIPDYYLFTDADIEHHPTNLQELVAKAKRENLDLVSLMVLLRCQSFWEKLLIPAFVFFFQKLYPFRFVNDPNSKIAAAAGGCILIRPEALMQIGGLKVLCQTLIDDCTLAQQIKASPEGRKIWLGLTQSTKSLRPYPDLKTIWDMVTRTAYTQLNYSPLLLLGTLLGMSLIYLMGPIGAVIFLFAGYPQLAVINTLTWLLMTIAYLPMIRFYKLSLIWAFTLPVIAFLYTLMTIDSAIKYWRGQATWKGRVY